MKISIGYSPCPNDTFIFYALTHNKLTSDIEFKETLKDVETLNRLALQKVFDITKASFHGFGFLRDKYCLLHSGSALGRGCGPLIVARNRIDQEELISKKIAIPGKMTTAYLLLQMFAPGAKNIVHMPFDRIMNAVSMGSVDAGLIIHESRFVYPQYDLVKIIDLGEWWENKTGLPIPLGGILARRDLGATVIRNVDGLIRQSLEYASRHPEETVEYIKKNAQELDDEVIEQHIKLYVNDYTRDLGDGIAAVEKLLEIAEELNLIPHSEKMIFVD
ncbi:MAG: 1,4-dihydroxy-6-naphthoate synthase [Candidatus Methanoperedens sp.]|nr:1,4-dihydroxy-6-naphthoate synthase [Candidatus Methanoperedens sp.]CAG0972872.1 1,4-dihydroxy-6-naphthoate synthase [Methanosarcinales archaeon]